MAQLPDFREIPENACFFDNEACKTLNSLLEANKLSDNLFEFKLLEKERIFPGENFNIKTIEINKALTNIDVKRQENAINQEITSRLHNLTIQEKLIDQRDSCNYDISKRIEEEEQEEPENLLKNQGKLYDLRNVEFDEEKTVQEAQHFLENLEKNENQLEESDGKAKFLKEVCAKKMKNEEHSMKNLKKNMDLLSFSDEMCQE